MDKLIVLLVVLLFVLLKINQYLKNKNTHKTAEELALDKKNRENEEFFDDIARHSSLRYDYLGQNINNDD